MIALAALLVNIFERKQEGLTGPMAVVDIGENEIDPAVWGQNYPDHYDRFMRTAENYGATAYGGSEPYSKLERHPAMKRLWAGYSFAIDHNEERGHYYAKVDQENTQRVKVVSQPGACINCHAAEAPGLIDEMGWETFNRTPYNDLLPQLHLGTSCADCHDPESMSLRITRLAFRNAMEALDVNLEEATRQEMRTYVCAQCHVEYYFQGEDKLLTFPWTEGLNIDSISTYYENIAFGDWTHGETGGQMIKVQHPEYELWSTGLHARSGVSCADCHMPYMRVGATKISDHWIRSPLVNVSNACGTCHNRPDEELRERVWTIQHRTSELLYRTEEAIVDAIDAIVDAQERGVPDAELAEARRLHREASLRWDFVSSENSTGFHSPQEAARVLATAIDLARQAERKAASG